MEEHKEQKKGTLHHSFRSESMMLALGQGKAKGKPPEIEMKKEAHKWEAWLYCSLASYWMALTKGMQEEKEMWCPLVEGPSMPSSSSFKWYARKRWSLGWVMNKVICPQSWVTLCPSSRHPSLPGHAKSSHLIFYSPFPFLPQSPTHCNRYLLCFNFYLVPMDSVELVQEWCLVEIKDFIYVDLTKKIP